MIAVPLTPLLFFLMVWLQLPMWTLLLAGTVWPQLVCGLVERRIRGELRLRALDAGLHALAPLPAEPLRSSELAFILLAGLGALGSTLAVAAAWGVGPALLTALVLVVVERHFVRRRDVATAEAQSRRNDACISP
ncbi:hypothetical protein OV203_25360 [Nannocystis sp. ILAH1]|uniref:hypothetical protein n=1 Tax=unclassified Nannocystis TaxID=2627009 RepID=UPI00226F2407|nr:MULTISPECIES: hypothetical protein [unclassified Nannocystis]MCY0990495.1 hypothetical protein [Nannocystis sp. ILAH1]MCY1069217.1 hypothetical protein [Nannocystis sp. RBIL2]